MADTSNPSPRQTGWPAKPMNPTFSTEVCEARTAAEVVIVVGMNVVNVVEGERTVEGIDVTRVVGMNEEDAPDCPILVPEEREVATPDEPGLEPGPLDVVDDDAGSCEWDCEPPAGSLDIKG